MNKQIDNKAIEEMAKIIANKMCYAFIDGRCSLNGSACDLICRQGNEYKEVAEALYNAGYRKVDSNKLIATIVVPDEKLEEIKKECLENVEYNIQEISKETAREILQWLVDTGLIEQAPDTTKTHFKEKYGVEVK